MYKNIDRPARRFEVERTEGKEGMAESFQALTYWLIGFGVFSDYTRTSFSVLGGSVYHYTHTAPGMVKAAEYGCVHKVDANQALKRPSKVM